MCESQFLTGQHSLLPSYQLCHLAFASQRLLEELFQSLCLVPDMLYILCNSQRLLAVWLEKSISPGAAAKATEECKHRNNDVKCEELGWHCIPMVVESYGCWGTEARQALSQLASRLAVRTKNLQIPNAEQPIWSS
ncbi:hypothetical protein EMCRGX_G027712 [Ephydatia muelleri]